MNELFLESEESEYDEPPLKIQKTEYEEHDSRDLDSDSDLDSLNDSDFEDIVLQPLQQSQQNQATEQEFNISIQSIDEEKKEKLRQLIRLKQQRVSLHYLSIVSYIIHARHRNLLLSDKRVHKALKKLLPEQLMKQFKKYKKQPDDVKFIYILKYLIKWFKKNFKWDSNGLRVLGYLPKKYKSTADYLPNNAKAIGKVNDLLQVIKKFRHNRDTGAQIFTALLRSLGFEARLVFSLPVLDTKNQTKLQPKLNQEVVKVNKDNDLLYPYFWTEVVNPEDPSEVIVLETQCFFEETKQLIRLKRYKGDVKNSYTDAFYPIDSQLCHMSMHYVLAFTDNNMIIDVSSRYMKNIAYRWFNRLDLRTELGRAALLLQSLIRTMNATKHYNEQLNLELDNLRSIAMANNTIPETYSAMKKSPNFITPSTLRYNEIIIPGTVPIKKIKLNTSKEPVYFKNYILVGKSEQQWKFVGRSIKPDQIDSYIKLAKATPRTIYNKRVFNLNNETNPELNSIKLYSFAQTCPYIKLKVENGKLPKNKYGNIEIFRPNMVPDECVWLRLSNIESILSRTLAHYVPVVVGFKFKSGHAFPRKDGVIVLKKDEVPIKKLWLTGKIEEHKQLEEHKQIQLLKSWKSFLKMLKIQNRLNEQHGYL
ncbi:uncharacterized protein KGF55_000974 [Candida pseudojiufengensis]|uniref:uncharacterized protein n=1 Tax=Candida pseudojiufengensis TaxID=497109 RepID=UPI002225AB89|nr:uncharacterized protein KGF55_000974 [Candida pseudojiufengensis]KAI5965612.1 hypothetical protein KGF55_000974 [Candida pseudojiufengensis]